MRGEAGLWRGRRVIITGPTGFKGSWMVFRLAQLGARIFGYALAPPTIPCLFDSAEIEQDLESHVIGDVRDALALARAIKSAEPEIIFHLAAQPLVLPSYDDPIGTYATNVMGAVHLLDAVRGAGSVRAVVNVTSDKCYENQGWLWGYRENEPMGGRDPYSNSKGCAELVTAAFRHSFFVSGSPTAIATARAGNVIGGGDWAPYRLIPDLVAAFLAGRPATIRRPGAIRPWQHVLDPLEGYLLLAEALCRDGAAYADGWNFGPSIEEAWPVSRLTECMAALWGEGACWVDTSEQGQQPHEEHTLMLDCSKARSRLGWTPSWGIEKALAHTIAWYRLHARGGNFRELMLEQVSAYNHARAMGKG